MGGDGGWDWQGFGNIDGQKALIEGTASYVASTATGGMRDEYMRAFSSAFIGAYVKKGVSELFEHYGGRDFGDTYSLDKPITVDTLSISTRQFMDSLMDYFANDGKNTMKVVEKVPKYVKKREYVFEKPATSDGHKFSLSDLGALSVPKTTIVEKIVQEGFEDRERTIEFVDNRTMGEKLVDGFANAFKGFTTIGTSFAQEWQTIKNDASTLGTALSAAFAYAYEGAKNLVNMAINGVKNLFGGSEVKVAVNPVQKSAFNSLQEKGRSEWSKKLSIDLEKEGKKVKVVQHIYQKSSSDCLLTCEIMDIASLKGTPVDANKVRKDAKNIGAVNDDYYILAGGREKLQEFEGVEGYKLDPVRGSGEKLLKSMIEEFHAGREVTILLGAPYKGENVLVHAERAYGYDFDDKGNLRILLFDPGNQKDKYLDPKNMQPFKGYNTNGDPKYSAAYYWPSGSIFPQKIQDWRTVYGYNVYRKK